MGVGHKLLQNYFKLVSVYFAAKLEKDKYRNFI